MLYDLSMKDLSRTACVQRTYSVRTFESMASMTEIVEDTLDPPTMAAKGLLGTSTAPDKDKSGVCVRIRFRVAGCV